MPMGMAVVRTLVERGTLGDGTSRVMADAFLISCVVSAEKCKALWVAEMGRRDNRLQEKAPTLLYLRQQLEGGGQPFVHAVDSTLEKGREGVDVMITSGVEKKGIVCCCVHTFKSPHHVRR